MTQQRFASFILFSLLLLLSIPIKAQYATVLIEVPDSLIYSLFIGGESLHEDYQGEIKVDSLSPGTCLIDIIIKNGIVTHLRANMLIDTLRPTELVLSTDSLNRYRLERRDGPTNIDYTLPAGQAANELTVEVNVTDATTCAPPMTTFRFERLIREIEGMYFERDRVKKLQSILGEECLTTAQIRSFVTLIEDDGRRLELLVKSHGSCFDVASFHRLEDLLYLSRNQGRFNLLFGQ